MIESSTSGAIAGMIAEPIQGVGGFITPPKEYFKMAFSIVKKYGGEAVVAAADQHFVAVIEPGAQHVAQAHDARRAVGAQHVHVQREAAFQLRGAEKRFHENFGLGAAGFRLQHQAHGFGAFVAHIAQ